MESPVKDVIEVLKLRLARGEITVTEYKEILKTVGEVEDEIFNENFEEHASGDTSLTNTGKQIVEVDELQVCEHCFFYKSARYEFSSVRRVHGNRSTFSVNFVPMFKNTYLTVLFDNNQEITLREERAYFGGNRHKKIDNALQGTSQNNL